MSFNRNGVYTPVTGAENATPGEVIRSAIWNSIFTDISTLGLTVLGQAMWVTNPPRTVSSGSFTVLTSDNAVLVTGNSPTITVPASSLVTSPFAIIGNAASVFGSTNAVVLPSGGDLLSGVGTLTLATNYMVAWFYPITSGGYLVTYAQNTFSNISSGTLQLAGTSVLEYNGGTLVSTSGLISTGSKIGIGYATGAGGTVVQATSKTTGVTLNAACGQITMSNATLLPSTIVSFTLTDTVVAATDVLVLNHISGGTPGSYGLNAQCAAGSATINVRNNTAATLAEAIVLQFADIKASNN